MTDIEHDDEELGPEGWDPESSIAVKWLLDGCETLSAAADALQEIAADFRKKEAEGWQLSEQINDGFVFLQKGAAPDGGGPGLAERRRGRAL